MKAGSGGWTIDNLSFARVGDDKIIGTAHLTGDDGERRERNPVVINFRDGRIVATGLGGTDVDFRGQLATLRLLPDGSLDPSFGDGRGFVTTMVGENSIAKALVAGIGSWRSRALFVAGAQK